jgi:hypothetical protein
MHEIVVKSLQVPEHKMKVVNLLEELPTIYRYPDRRKFPNEL